MPNHGLETNHSLRLYAEAASLNQVIAFVHNGGIAAHLSKQRLDELHLIIEEIFVNLCCHAFEGAAPGQVTIRYSIPHPGLLHVEVADSGPPFNPLSAPDPDLTLSLTNRPIGGLGIYLVKTLAASTCYRRASGWNHLSFDLCV